ncbi:hypothetical protein HELRODRAFT_178391 [Helobdella robusta]|uniref:Uncharacterized protein n=1 Tax=Helobdella robusta TaxID=6412 RepID=T1FD43_HELRO|nr:hypothetical protein HELRODRAFT_178391 [Helobdella robusta]ESN97267.1 hypothetical protein HELRODRAFT_178391 [Helobdella robusta]
MYGSLSGYYFHAKNVKIGDWIVLAFEEDDVHLSKVVIETGYNNRSGLKLVNELSGAKTEKRKSNSIEVSHEFGNLPYELVEGSLEISPKILKIEVDKNVIRCADFRLLGNVSDGNNNLLNKILMDRWRSDDPAADVFTNMEAVDSKHTCIKMYGSLSGYYFHAKNVKIGDWIVLAFEEDDVHLSKVVIETGYNNRSGLKLVNELSGAKTEKRKSNSIEVSHEFGNLPYELVEGSLEISPKILKIEVDKNVIRCADFRLLGNVSGYRTIFDNLMNVYWNSPTKCLKFTVTNVITKMSSDLVIRQLAIFT